MHSGCDHDREGFTMDLHPRAAGASNRLLYARRRTPSQWWHMDGEKLGRFWTVLPAINALCR